MTWSETEYSPASAAEGKRRQKHNQTADVAIFLGCICISPLNRDVARPQRRAIFPVRAANSRSERGEFPPPTHKTSHNFFLPLFSRPAGFTGPPPVRLPVPYKNTTHSRLTHPPHRRPFLSLPSYDEHEMLIESDARGQICPYTALIQEITVNDD